LRAPPITALVVDDEPGARRNLTVLLSRDPDIKAVVECDSGSEAVQIIPTLKPDLVFLDVQMPGCGGFDVLELLGGSIACTIIFVTAYDEYALRAFEAGALDYLMKPFDDARFHRALNRAKDKLAHYTPLRSVERLVVKNRGEALFLNVADIDWIEAVGCYACLHVGPDTHIMRRTLLQLEQDLGEEKFIRIHRSIIVQLDRIHAMELQNGGDYEVVLKSSVRLRLSRRFRKRLQDRMRAIPGRDQRSAPKRCEHGTSL
jgi:two-component system LytT family response regulator